MLRPGGKQESLLLELFLTVAVQTAAGDHTRDFIGGRKSSADIKATKLGIELNAGNFLAVTAVPSSECAAEAALTRVEDGANLKIVTQVVAAHSGSGGTDAGLLLEVAALGGVSDLAAAKPALTAETTAIGKLGIQGN